MVRTIGRILEQVSVPWLCVIPCLTAEPIAPPVCQLITAPTDFFFPHAQSLLPRPVSLLHILIVLFLHICLTLFLPVFPPLMAQTQITWVASKTTIRKGFSLLWFPIIIGIPFPHHAAASLITLNTERAGHAALWAESPRSHFNLWLYQ